MPFEFRQVDVFSTQPLGGNPVAVVHDADALTDEQMAAFARWTNLSETTFLLAPADTAADYRLRIFTPGGELPFAGHPTLGSAHAWLEAGGAPRAAGRVVQECAAGLVEIRTGDDGLAFQAPPRIRSGAVEEGLLARVAGALGVPRGAIVDAEWCDNGPGWVGVRFADAAAVLALRPTFADLPASVGAVGAYADGADCAIEVRAFCDPAKGVGEDPVTGSLNAALGQWLAGGFLPERYVASQGTALGRRGRVHVSREAGAVWVGGATRTTIRGSVDL
ncbi:PhzF family phenazine biosynthesis protein [Microbacterium excoecariae]|uniref:PhzF family phenazine biosynthesis protein n=1 Tax=Microbacterium excoecariae TaxID=2715210 RepID=UPI00140861F5|nr:PhzF family phenazine biosynthesis protein [Microbacterium excoecariae]NHI16092.1 PhzF family phenazine biosynthesis protein [Microbacterium excoecariae]